MKPCLAIAPQIANRGHNKRKQWRQKLLQIIADEKILLARFSYHSRRINCVLAMKNRIGLKHGIVVLQRVIAVMISERAFGLAKMRGYAPAKRKFSLSNQLMSVLSKRVCDGTNLAVSQ